VQAVYAIFLLYAGWRFVLYVRWAMGEAEDFVPKPPSVEGFLPISALIAFKRLLFTGQWDPVHPAGLFIFIAVLGMAVLLRKGFCGYICPVGFISSLLARLGARLRIARRTGPRVSRLLSLPKYLLLAQFAWISVVSMDVESIEGFLLSPYNFVADTRMLQFFLAPSPTAARWCCPISGAGCCVPTARCSRCWDAFPRWRCGATRQPAWTVDAVRAPAPPPCPCSDWSGFLPVNAWAAPNASPPVRWTAASP